MASGSLASTTNHSGTSVNTVVVDDEWTEWFPKEEVKETVYLEYNTNPLALVCAMIRNGKQPFEAAETLNGVGARVTRQINFDNVIEREDEDRANEILKYFAKKHTMRRIKGEWVSEYMRSIDEIVDNPKRINKEHVRILVTLPRIYEQNRGIERVIKGHKSAPTPNNLSFPAMEGEVTFVERLHFKVGRNNEYHYFWRTPKNYLMRIVVQKGHYGSEAWDLLAKHGKIHVSADVTHTFNIKGYDFNVVQPSPEHMEIEIT
jgi:hypothetical protein